MISIIIIVIIYIIILIILIFSLIKKDNLKGGEFTKLLPNNDYNTFNKIIFSLNHLIDVEVFDKNIININKTKMGFYKLFPQKYLSDSYYFNKIINKNMIPSNVLSSCEFKSKYLTNFIKKDDINILRDSYFEKSNNPTYLNTKTFNIGKNFYDINFKPISKSNIANSLYYYDFSNYNKNNIIFCHIDISYKELYDFKSILINSYNDIVNFLKNCVPNKINYIRYFYDKYGNTNNNFAKYDTIIIPATKSNSFEMDIFSLILYNNKVYLVQIEHSENDKNHKSNLVEFIGLIATYYNYSKEQLKQELINAGYSKVKNIKNKESPIIKSNKYMSDILKEFKQV